MVSASVLALDVDKLHRDWEWMLSTLREVLIHSGDEELAALLPDPDKGPTVDDRHLDSVQLTQAYSIAFQLLSMGEQIAAIEFRKTVEHEEGLDQLPALWGESLKQLKDSGLSAEEIAAALPSIQVELVLTAHPTEAKRATVLAHHRRLFDRFVAKGRADFAPWQNADNETAIRSLLAVLWRTGEIYLDKPDLQSERRNVVDYLTHVFPAALRPLDLRLRQAWEEVGLDPAAIADPLALPKLTFGTWVGGDRDGHPFVTPEVTATTLMELRSQALTLIRRELVELVRLISLSAFWLPPRGEFLEEIARRVRETGDAGQKAVDRNPNEPWRQFVNLMMLRLPTARNKQQTSTADFRLGIAGTPGNDCDSGVNHYQDPQEILADLRVLYGALDAVAMREAADFSVRPIMRIVQSFGFHLAVLDIRQNSAMHDKAIEQLLAAAGHPETDYGSWPEEKRVAFLTRELNSSRPFVHSDRVAGPEAETVLGALRVVTEHLKQYGSGGLGALIVSMTRQTSDLLGVYLLAREVGLLQETESGTVCPMPVVPLFETIEDLEHSPEIYDRFLAFPMTAASLDYVRQTRGQSRRTGQIMIGYSDSNKDGGILASLVGLRQAQSQLTQVGAKYDTHVRFFHGRGGTISRGAGPTHRFIRSLPDGTLSGDLRLTEQGETIAQKYAHQPSAIYNLELFLAGVTRKTLLDNHLEPETHPLEETLVDLSKAAREAYHDLLHTDGFVDFFRQATPIDAIEQSSIGSRPSRRSGQRTLADLRAIPWVFSWGQSRCYLSGWYGVGTALKQLEESSPKTFKLVVEKMYGWSPLHYLMSNVATSVAAVDMNVADQYAALVEDSDLRNRFHSRIAAELELTRQMIERVYGGSLDDKRPNVQRMIELRSGGLQILHTQQIRLLRRWRSYHSMGEKSQADALLPQLLLTVNAIASGLGTTG
ncbi:MAG: phosphoenolpyruvate carboxylase [Aureliella sp.]